MSDWMLSFPLPRFICYRKKSEPTLPSLSSHSHSALMAAVEPTQDSSPSELLALCSGRFDEGGAEPGTHRERHLSDSSSSQAVREILGLPLASKPQVSRASCLLPSSIGSLVGGVATDDTTQVSQMSEVLGLCSGVFQPTPAPGTTARVRQVKNCTIVLGCFNPVTSREM